MGEVLRQDAQIIMDAAIEAALPHTAVRKALEGFELPSRGELVLVAIGKAAYAMTVAAYDLLGDQISRGILITKDEHSGEPLPRLTIREAGHPVLDERGVLATQEALQLVDGLKASDRVLLLISGGGSALFESPRIPLDELKDITQQMLKSGADIVEMNTVRKRLSHVKGGRFALACQPAQVYAVVLSDILGDPLDMIASGPAHPDSSTSSQARAIVRKYGLRLSEAAQKCLEEETPKSLDNVITRVTGSVRQLCAAAREVATALGYEPVMLTSSLNCLAREAGAFLAAIARDQQEGGSLAYILGGETVVKVTGQGKGGRNQEIALSAALGIQGLRETAVFSIGSDGTDGPTDAAGGYCDGETVDKLAAQGINTEEYLNDNNAYPALSACGGLVITGPTGTNVNDLTVLLIKRG